MKTRSGFEKGSGCYRCESCGKLTRSTGRGDNELSRVCVTCWDDGGLENEHSDFGHDAFVPGCPTCREECGAKKTGGSKGQTKGEST